jgi:hypothetical protein
MTGPPQRVPDPAGRRNVLARVGEEDPGHGQGDSASSFSSLMEVTSLATPS